MNNYILDEHGEPRLEPDIRKWAEWFETADRLVARTQIGDVLVSTVFLGSDYNFGGEGLPLPFETMVFGGPLDEEQRRWHRRTEAEAGHKATVERVRHAIPQESTNAT